jgi:exodeoxyribonuclease VII large subunit
MHRSLERMQTLLGRQAARLDAMSPLAVLARGYAIATTDAGAVRNAADLAKGDRVSVRVHRGKFVAEVKEVFPEEQLQNDVGTDD